MRYLVFLCAISLAAQSPQLTCDATGDPLLIRSEGLTERLGNIVITCQGPPNGVASGGISVFLSATVTNRLAGETINVAMTAESVNGIMPIGGAPRLVGRNGIFFDPFTVNIPANGLISFRISNIRVATDPTASERPVTAFISTSGFSGIGIRNNPVTIGITRRSLYANASNSRILCRGVELPEEITFGELLGAGASHASLRVTEGTPAAFERASAGTTNGVRVLLNFSGLPASARVFIPDVIVGSSGVQPTSAGDFGAASSGGVWTPSIDGSLLLARVPNADASGGGDTPIFNPMMAGATTTFSSVAEVRLQGGAGHAVYEVVEANGNVLESAQIPVLVVIPLRSRDEGTVAEVRVRFAPLSSIAEASARAPILRFADVDPPVDCPILRDCNAAYFPRLFVEAQPLTFIIPANTIGFFQRFIRVVNDGGSTMVWTATVRYRNGSRWLRIFPEFGVNNASINVDFLPVGLTPGLYEATLVIDAGPVAGTRSLPVSLQIINPLPPPVVNPAIRTLHNYADPTITAAVPGSISTVVGANLVGQQVRVAFDGLAATILATSSTASGDRIDLLVPVELGLRPNAQLQLTRDGTPSALFPVTVSAAAPAILRGGVLNQDGAPNAEGNPETVGRTLQVFATGLPAPGLGAYLVRIHDREISSFPFAGPLVAFPGVQQVNVVIPEDLPGMVTDLVVCGAPVNNPTARECSNPARVAIARPPEP